MSDPDNPTRFTWSRRGPMIWGVTLYSMVGAPAVIAWDTAHSTSFAAVALPILLGAVVGAPGLYVIDRTIRNRSGGDRGDRG